MFEIYSCKSVLMLRIWNVRNLINFQGNFKQTLVKILLVHKSILTAVFRNNGAQKF